MSVPTIELQGNICKVIAHQARGLIVKGKEETNNAFVTFNLGKSKFATSVLEKTSDPEWHEECEFVISDYGGTLELIVCHSDFLRERFLGRVEISVSGVAASHGRSVKRWYKLQPKKGKEAKKLGDRGQLEVTVQILYRTDAEQQGLVKDKKSLLNIIPSPVAWRRKSSEASPSGGRRDTHTHDEFHNDINTDLQYHEQQPMEAAFYSDDSQSVASSVSDDHRDVRHHHQHSESASQDMDRGNSVPTPPLQQKPPTSGAASNRFRPGGVQGSARGKGGVRQNMKAALGTISKALSRDNLDRAGLHVSTPDLRQTSTSLPPTPIHHNQNQPDYHQQHPDHHHNNNHQRGNGHIRTSSGTDEVDLGAPTPSIHLGISSFGGSVGAQPLHKSASEECLTDRKGKGHWLEKVDAKGDALSSTTLPRQRYGKRENRHKKTKSACITTLSELSFHDDHVNTTDEHKGRHQSNSLLDAKEEKQSKDHKQPMSTGPSKYDTLNKQQLVQLVQQQESIMADNFKQIKDLEDYVERLLVRVMVESPHLLDLNYPIRL